jgi:H+/gluconate symporter-like permease
MKPAATTLLFAMIAVLAVPAVTRACPLCKGAVANDELTDGPRTGPTRTARAYGWSIAVMLCMPFLVIGGITFIAVSAYRRNLAQQQSGSEPRKLR